jgi:hypothetical protein
MVVVKRGGNIVIGLTPENMVDILGGGVIKLAGSDIDVPGLTFYVVQGSHSDILADLRRNGIEIPGEPQAD